MIQLIPLFLGFPLIGFWLWMLVDMTNNEYISADSKRNWFVSFILLNVFAAFWYYTVEYRPRHM